MTNPRKEIRDKAIVKSLLSQKPTPRRQMKALSPFYDDQLQIDAFATGKSVADQAASLLQAKLKERQPLVDQIITGIAVEKGVSPELLRHVILKKELPDISEEEIERIQEKIEKYEAENTFNEDE